MRLGQGVAGRSHPHPHPARHPIHCAGAVADSVFLSLHSWLGPLAFLLFAAVVAAAGIWVYAVVPETAGRTLQEIQALLALRAARGSRGGAQQEQQGLLPPGAALSDGLPLSAR